MNVIEIFSKFIVDTNDFDNALDSASNKASSFGSAFGSVMGGVGKAAAMAAAGLTATAGAVGMVAQQASGAYAEYQQLTGGIETLFEDQEAVNEVMANASDAYKTAGMSTNDYMDTVINMAASLNKATGDTMESARLADVAITDMADNVNKMGTSMESVQNAYRGFTRGNFTMLDNLALGYSGTKEGMQELLADAEKISGIKYDVSSYADIVNAIHVVQENMGITGTTAQEAGETISGSAASMKAAWDNLMLGIADPNADLGQLIDNMVTTAETSLTNMLPTFTQAITGIGQLVQGLAPVVADELPKVLDSVLPPLLDAAGTLLTNLSTALPDLIGSLVTVITSALPGLITTIGTSLPKIITSLSTTIKNLIGALPSIISPLAKAIADNAPILLDAILEVATELVSNVDEIILPILDVIPDLLMGLGQAILENIEPLYSAIFDSIIHIAEALPDLLPELVAGLLTLFTAGLEKMPVLVDMMVTALPQIIEPLIEGVIRAITDNLPLILSAFVALFTNYVPSYLKLILGIVAMIIVGLYDGIKAALGECTTELWDNIKAWWEQTKTNIADGWNTFITAIKMWFNDLPYNLGCALADMLIKIGEWATSVWDWITNDLPKIIEGIIEWFATLPVRICEWFGEVIVKIATWASDMIDKIQEVLPDVIDGIATFFEELPDKAIEWGKDMIQGFIDGVGDMAKEAWGAVEDFAQGIADRIGFSEPELGPLSDFHTYAPDMMELFAQGIKDNEDLVASAMDKSLSFKPAVDTSGMNMASTMDGRYVAEQPTINLMLEVDGEAFGRLVYKLNGEQDQRVGVNMVEAFG